MTNYPLTVHHLGRSQSERIVWLCEELGLEYELKRYERRQDNRMAPPEYQALHPLGTAPVITDGALVLGESAAIVEYLIATHGNGRLAVSKDLPGFADYLYWFHFANGTLQPLVLQTWLLQRADPSEHNAALHRMQARFHRVFATIEQRLGDAPYLAGEELTAADIMTVFSLTTMREFNPYDLSPWPNILAYLQRIGARPAYQRAMRKAEPEGTPLLGATP
ncbi:MAG: glutathione S-transferase family protein [Rudaea sp.]|uniref:glutathione S-transferase family protein n=1 Tax=unclassified Rudaea TaxID=2627037 RepID=UPI0010FA1480|nr:MULTISPECIES: glutathione S-transferase family protein [unclassified Rudaea]MBN8885056.1 glutathione S-transferase family protein [Rudaea sp.]MBR0347133.1 glutathione S-transferase family protein [Rudaea sp.]